ncbi:MAG: hypothetical protein C0P75_013295 [Bacilli bacterium]|jgi:hypothetical protein|uniref:Uncharacterized protein n=1 Tax=Ureibacillus suwonensis TaxID=313007 RepID=A0ABW0RC95_9BACL|nr:hypothetical protein [Bacilli bacterium]
MIYEFIACNQKLPTFQEALEDEQMKSYNELLALGLSEEQIAIRGVDLKGIDRDKKVFWIRLPDELLNSPLLVEKDSHNPYARYLSDKKYVYKLSNVSSEIIPHVAYYLLKYANLWRELEIWRVIQDDYLIDMAEIPHRIIPLHVLTLEDLEAFFDRPAPRKMTITQP